ncbi:MAG TPA: hypothetical protein VGF75_00910 [Candidatus Saccharimonadales bacterium]
MKSSHNNQKDLVEALYWIRVSQRQIASFVDSLISVAELGVKDAMPALADGHFLLVAAAQVERTLKRAQHPIEPDIAFSLRKLRDIHEHWEQHKESFKAEDSPKSLSGKDFASMFPGALPWRYAMDATGVWISTLRLEDLWHELLLKEKEIGSLIVKLQVPYSADVTREFPKRESKILGFAMITQDIIVRS